MDGRTETVAQTSPMQKTVILCPFHMCDMSMDHISESQTDNKWQCNSLLHYLSASKFNTLNSHSIAKHYTTHAVTRIGLQTNVVALCKRSLSNKFQTPTDRQSQKWTTYACVSILKKSTDREPHSNYSACWPKVSALVNFKCRMNKLQYNPFINHNLQMASVVLHMLAGCSKCKLFIGFGLVGGRLNGSHFSLSSILLWLFDRQTES